MRGQPGGRIGLGQDLRRQRRGLQALLAARAGVLLAHVLQHLHLGGHVVELLGDFRADLDERAAAGALPLALGQIVDDRDAWQVGGDGLAAGFGAGRALSSRCGVALSSTSAPTASFNSSDRLRFVEELALTGRDAELLAARPVMIGLQYP